MKGSEAEASFAVLGNGREDAVGRKDGARGRTDAFRKAVGDERQTTEDIPEAVVSGSHST